MKCDKVLSALEIQLLVQIEKTKRKTKSKRKTAGARNTVMGLYGGSYVRWFHGYEAHRNSGMVNFMLRLGGFKNACKV